MRSWRRLSCTSIWLHAFPTSFFARTSELYMPTSQATITTSTTRTTIKTTMSDPPAERLSQECGHRRGAPLLLRAIVNERAQFLRVKPDSFSGRAAVKKDAPGSGNLAFDHFFRAARAIAGPLAGEALACRQNGKVQRDLQRLAQELQFAGIKPQSAARSEER